MIIDHVSLPVSDFEKSKAFYLMALAPLGIGIQYEEDAKTTGTTDFAGFGTEHGPEFWIGGLMKADRHMSHVAFKAKDRKSVDAFYAAALAAGGIDNGAPGLRPHYGEHYYGAFIIDLDGVNIEAVCHLPNG
ncbi:MAG: VOC family protein [Thalassospira sp.]|uniref:VOC family protein n=1 Tax=Thalassospira sp. TaxID=1912094 RepID=UPI0032F00AD9